MVIVPGRSTRSLDHIRHVVRSIARDDLDAVIELWRASVTESHPFLSREFLRKTEKAMRERTLMEFETVVLDDGGIRAYLSRAGVFIDALFVSPSFQGRGLGKQLLDHAKSQSKLLELSAFSLNPRAVKFYQREGFWATTVKIHRETGESLVMLRWEGKE